MLRRRLLAVLPVVALGATAAFVLPGGSAAAAPPSGTAGKTYVALGDSYAAGFGLPPSEGTPTGLPVAGCAQTTGDYPHLLAATLGLDLTDVTCSGAVTTDFGSPQLVPGGTAPAQLDVFKTVQPDLVTITIGGNDLGFSGISLNCLADSSTGPLLLHPTFANCHDYFTSTAADGGAADNPYDAVAPTLAKVDGAIKAVQAAAPNAKIAVIAYPAITPDAANTPTGGCYAAEAVTPPIDLGGGLSIGSALPFADVDTPFLQVLQQQLDEGIAATAAANGAAYADIYPSSLAHSACQPESTRWVEPLVPAALAQGANNKLHPNLAGTTAMAAVLAPVVSALIPTAPTSTPPSTTAAPTAPTTAASTVVAVGGTEPLANTGTRLPVSWLVGLATLLLAGGVTSLRLARPGRARH